MGAQCLFYLLYAANLQSIHIRITAHGAMCDSLFAGGAYLLATTAQCQQIPSQLGLMAD